jgi:phospholipid transport system transporter-binding protein
MISCTGGNCLLQGPVTMANVAALLEAGARQFAGTSVTVDLAGITEVDSSAVSLLLEWRRQAQFAHRAIHFVNIPANLRSLAELYGVTKLVADGVKA